MQLDWNTMEKFLSENKGLIIKLVTRYRFAYDECTEEIENAYCDAVKTFNPDRTHKYKFTTHFCQYLKSYLKNKSKVRDNEVLIDDLLSRDDRNGADDLPCRKRACQASVVVYHSSDGNSKIKEIVSRIIRKYGYRNAEKALMLAKYGEFERAIEIIPDFKADLQYIIVYTGMSKE